MILEDGICEILKKELKKKNINSQKKLLKILLYTFEPCTMVSQRHIKFLRISIVNTRFNLGVYKALMDIECISICKRLF